MTIFSVFAGYFFGNFRDEASVINLRMISQCQLFSDPKKHDLEWLFRVKICFARLFDWVRPYIRATFEK